jgi:hypothetical protein
MPNNTDAEILQVLRRQAQQDRFVDLIFAECRLIPFEARPRSQAPTSIIARPNWPAHDHPGETKCPGAPRASRPSERHDSRRWYGRRLSRCESLEPPMSQMGQSRSFGDVGSMSGLPESGNRSALLRCRKGAISDTGPATPSPRRTGEAIGAQAAALAELSRAALARRLSQPQPAHIARQAWAAAARQR